jgi:hypothetical protein
VGDASAVQYADLLGPEATRIRDEPAHQHGVSGEQVRLLRRVPGADHLVGAVGIFDLEDLLARPEHALAAQHCRGLVERELVALDSQRVEDGTDAIAAAELGFWRRFTQRACPRSDHALDLT